MPAPDPRVFFAAERTLLAWVRTGVTVMTLGFVVERFGLFIHMLAAGGAAVTTIGLGERASSGVGILLMVLGAAVVLAAAHNHRRFVRALPRQDVPKTASTALSLALAVAVALIGILLALVLAIA
ncbi:MAG: YidH family protein [Gammaproteobacteria bacterium]